MIAWAPAEASRIGEVALFEPEDGARILGRGDLAGAGERVWFQRQRPGVSERTGPLASPGLSREQLRVRAESGSLRVDRVGKCPVLLAGRPVDTCVLRPGDALVLRGQMVLYCTRRPWSMAPLTSARLEDAPAERRAELLLRHREVLAKLEADARAEGREVEADLFKMAREAS